MLVVRVKTFTKVMAKDKITDKLKEVIEFQQEKEDIGAHSKIYVVKISNRI